MEKIKKKKSYDVGDKKPPVSSQFKPGQSGNPLGRPPGRIGIRRALRELIQSENEEGEIFVHSKHIRKTEAGYLIRVPKAKQIALNLLNIAAVNDKNTIAAVKLIMDNTEGPLPVHITTDLDKAFERITKLVNDGQ